MYQSWTSCSEALNQEHRDTLVREASMDRLAAQLPARGSRRQRAEARAGLALIRAGRRLVQHAEVLPA